MRSVSPRCLILGAVILAACGPAATVHHPAEGALGPYSGSVVSGGFCFASGKLGRRGGSFEEEASTALDALEEELARCGATLADLVQVTVYLSDMSLYAPLNEIYARRVPAPSPARACIAVKELPGGARVEVIGIARCP
jgi:2-iminobutanoate/2-iminopropanoate deaminase